MFSIFRAHDHAIDKVWKRVWEAHVISLPDFPSICVALITTVNSVKSVGPKPSHLRRDLLTRPSTYFELWSAVCAMHVKVGDDAERPIQLSTAGG